MPAQTDDVQVTLGDAGFEFADGRRVAFTGELEAWSAADGWLMWTLDDDPHLYLSVTDAPGADTIAVPAPLEAEAICHGARDEGGVVDVFLGDGDGQLVHYWAWLDAGLQLREVRRLWTNTDVTQCWVEGDAVVIDNGPLGITAYARDEEQDPILTAGRRSSNTRTGTWPGVAAAFETAPVLSSGDAADDAVVLAAADATWIVGTDKRWGLNAYDLQGRRVTGVNRGRLNNVDAVATDTGFLLAASNRTQHTLDLFTARPQTGELRFTQAIPITVNDPYGLCMGLRDGGVAIFVGGTDGEVQHWRLSAQGAHPEQQAPLKFGSQTEGCVYDPKQDFLYVGEEAVGVWRLDLSSGERVLMIPVDQALLHADVEGLDLCRVGDVPVLAVSSQGDDSFLLWPLEGDAAPLKFRVTAAPLRGIDGASETDGLACSQARLPGYPQGLLVVQDGRNRAPQEMQNFKAIDWRDLEALFSRRQTR